MGGALLSRANITPRPGLERAVLRPHLNGLLFDFAALDVEAGWVGQRNAHAPSLQPNFLAKITWVQCVKAKIGDWNSKIALSWGIKSRKQLSC